MPTAASSATRRLCCNQMLDDRSSGDAIPLEFSKGLHPCDIVFMIWTSAGQQGLSGYMEFAPELGFAALYGD